MFNKKTLLVLPEVFTALWNCNIENLLIKEELFFCTSFPNTVTLDEFESIQFKHIFQVKIV